VKNLEKKKVERKGRASKKFIEKEGRKKIITTITILRVLSLLIFGLARHII